MVTATTSYGHLPAELHDEILSYCTRASLVSLCLTSKSTSQEAEATLYDTITLHRSREHEKAELVQTFAVTLTEDHGDFNDLQLAVTALSGMKSLKVLSIWTPEEISTVSVQVLMRYDRLRDRSAFISSASAVSESLSFRLSSNGQTQTGKQKQSRKLQRPLAGHLLDTLNEQERMADPEQTTNLTSENQSNLKPVIFEVERRAHYFGDATLRTLTIYDYPLVASRGPRPTKDFLEFSAKNLVNEAYTQIHRDLSLDFSQDDELEITNQLQLVVCDISPNSLGWAQRVALPLLQPEAPLIGGTLVSLSIIEPPKRPFNVATIRHSFTDFVAPLLEKNGDEFFVQSYFVDEDNWDSHRPAVTEDASSSIISREESAEIGRALVPLVVEVVSSSKEGLERCLGLRIFHEEYQFPRPGSRPWSIRGIVNASPPSSITPYYPAR
ncbi:hypothetical protein NMY22_g13223 [Coprinellus aureogranulatus]|nr:hypothetical protein NMY22_g13223 [Coprinellus aureogranulatus]